MKKNVFVSIIIIIDESAKLKTDQMQIENFVKRHTVNVCACVPGK